MLGFHVKPLGSMPQGAHNSRGTPMDFIEVLAIPQRKGLHVLLIFAYPFFGFSWQFLLKDGFLREERLFVTIL